MGKPRLDAGCDPDPDPGAGAGAPATVTVLLWTTSFEPPPQPARSTEPARNARSVRRGMRAVTLAAIEDLLALGEPVGAPELGLSHPPLLGGVGGDQGRHLGWVSVGVERDHLKVGG